MTLSWEERIATAEKTGAFTRNDIADATITWTTCAVGERAAAEHLDALAIAWDNACEAIATAGYAFGEAVERNDIEEARIQYDAVQKAWAEEIGKLTPEERTKFEEV